MRVNIMLLEDFNDLDLLERTFKRTGGFSIEETSDSEIISFVERVLGIKTENVTDAIVLGLEQLLSGRVDFKREASISRLLDQATVKDIEIPNDIIDDIRMKAPDLM